MISFLKSCVDAVSDVATAFLRAIGLKSKSDDKIDSEVDQALDKVEDLVEDILQKYPLPKLIDDVKDFAGISHELVKLFSFLIKEAERFEKKSGREKKEFVVDAVLAVYDKFNIDLPDIPRFLEKPFLRLLTELLIDYMVDLFNTNFGKKWHELTGV